MQVRARTSHQFSLGSILVGAISESSSLLDLDSKGFLGVSGFPPSCESRCPSFNSERIKDPARADVASSSSSVM